MIERNILEFLKAIDGRAQAVIVGTHFKIISSKTLNFPLKFFQNFFNFILNFKMQLKSSPFKIKNQAYST